MAIQGCGTVWLNDRGNNRETIRIGGWDEETERGRDTKASLGWYETNKKSQDFNLIYPQLKKKFKKTPGKLLFPFFLMG